MKYKGGLAHYDTPVGVLCLESYFAKPPGHVRNPLTFRFPVICRVVRDVDVPRMLFNPTPDLVELFLDGARQLEKEGVLAIVGSCGFMALFQEELAQSVRVPVIASSLAQLPLLRLMHGPSARIGVLTASEQALTPLHFRKVGCDREDFSIKGMQDSPVFRETILEARPRPDMDMAAMREAICAAAEELHARDPLDALLLECTDLSAFAQDVQRRLSVPVYDINALVEYAAYCVSRPSHTHLAGPRSWA